MFAERLAYTETVSDQAHPETWVEVQLHEDGGRTTVELTHPRDPCRSPGETGWAMAFDRLPTRVLPGIVHSVSVTALGFVVVGFGIGAVDVMINVEGAAVERAAGRTLMPLLHAAWSAGAVAGAGIRRSQITKADVAIVIGCGPVGLAVISMLKARGVRTVVASDPSPGRRDLGRALGADPVIDPADASPFDSAGDRGHMRTIPAAAELGITTAEKLQRLPVAWHRTWRVIDALGIAPKRPVVFECVGVPGMLDQILTRAPMYSRIVVVGVCMLPDTIRPVMRSTRRSTSGSSSATPRWSSATPCTCWPRAGSTPPRC